MGECMAQAIEEIALAVIGGICGAVVADRLIEAGVRGERAAMAVMAGGGLAAIALRGKARSLAVGASAACAGQLALMWLQARATAAVQGETANPRAHAAPPSTPGPEPVLEKPANVAEQPEPPIDAPSNPAGVVRARIRPDGADSEQAADRASPDVGDGFRPAARCVAGGGP